MTQSTVQLLISVRSPAEAETAVLGGADVIDVKEPGHGPMGRAEAGTLRAILQRVAGRRPVSAALGEWDEPHEIVPPAVRFVKIGTGGAADGWRQRLGCLADRYGRSRVVVVAYADHDRAAAPPPKDVLDWGCRHGAAGILFDTAGKDGAGLFDWIDPATVARAIVQAQRGGLFTALAGSLRSASVEQAVALRPAIVAVRGAACTGGNRNARVDEALVRELAGFISKHAAPAAADAG